jgi:hypothetical protein
MSFHGPPFFPERSLLPQRVYKQNSRNNAIYVIEKYTQKVFTPRECINKMYFGAHACTFIFASTVLILFLN